MDATGFTGSLRPRRGMPFWRSGARDERGVGSGNQGRCATGVGDLGAGVPAAAGGSGGLWSGWADGPPFSADDAAAVLRRLESAGLLEPRASRAVQVAAGHGE